VRHRFGPLFRYSAAMTCNRSDAFGISSEGSENPRVVVLVGKLDAISQAVAERYLESVVADGATHVVLDCAELEFISSAGIRALLFLVKRVKPIGGAVSVCAPRPHVRQMLEFTGLKSILSISGTVEEGRAALSR
jgi:stage II sporulation protein AA (anti-sigma F factor antagonist)